jgi:hypothetical protein
MTITDEDRESRYTVPTAQTGSALVAARSPADLTAALKHATLPHQRAQQMRPPDGLGKR